MKQISTPTLPSSMQPLTVRTLALNPGQPLLLPFTYFLILGVCGWQKGEQHGNVKLLYSVCSPRPGTHKTQNPSGMDNSTHLKKIQYSPQAVQYGRSVSLGKGGERSMTTRGENIRAAPPSLWGLQRTACFMEPLSCLSSCQCGCSPAHQIPLNPGSEASSPAWAFPDAPTSILLILCLHCPQVSDFVWSIASLLKVSRLPGFCGA